MKNLKKTVIGLICSSMLVISMLGVNAFAQSTTNDLAKAKNDLAKAHEGEFMQMTPEAAQKRAITIDQQLCKLIAEGTSQGEIDTVMESNKLYKLNTPQNSGMIPLSQPADAICNAVSIYYDAGASQWVVSGGGWWTNDQWFNDKNWMWFPYYGETHNVGGLDSVGIAYNNTSGTYNASVISSAGYMTDQSGWSTTSYSPSHGDGSYGVAFDIQDIQKYNKNPPNPYIWSYDIAFLGKGYSALIRYNSNFTNWNGNARVFYAHTWNSCNITNLTLGYGSGFEFGVDIDFSTSNGWKIFTNSDTRF